MIAAHGRGPEVGRDEQAAVGKEKERASRGRRETVVRAEASHRTVGGYAHETVRRAEPEDGGAPSPCQATAFTVSVGSSPETR